jgi:hypothetical protein
MNFTPYATFVDEETPGDKQADGRYASGAFTVLSVGPSRVLNMGATPGSVALNNAGNAALSALTFPIGLVQQASVQNSRQFNRVFELGSERSYFISGRTQGQLSLARTYYHGMSLLRALTQFVPGAITNLTALTGPGSATALAENFHPTRNYPGFKDLWLNLASDLFSQPIGLMLKVHDTNEESIGATYMEGCYIPNHSFSTDSNGLLIQEQVGVMFERMVPVMVSTKDTVTATAQAATTNAIASAQGIFI